MGNKLNYTFKQNHSKAPGEFFLLVLSVRWELSGDMKIK